jgi:hypothetical protein
MYLINLIKILQTAELWIPIWSDPVGHFRVGESLSGLYIFAMRKSTFYEICTNSYNSYNHSSIGNL